MNRLKEPSTWAGIAGILGAFAPLSGPAAPWLAAAAAAAGSVAVALREQAPKGQGKK
ncbi:hypothetical protein [Solimonas fluminis]|uniref:hypothetical protein n=1 Tax=Solimonas fluminis TaxID=2086571 RepID=UPI0013FD7163|nr:hypothetical protein [Solimonas fluminis]